MTESIIHNAAPPQILEAMAKSDALSAVDQVKARMALLEMEKRFEKMSEAMRDAGGRGGPGQHNLPTRVMGDGKQQILGMTWVHSRAIEKDLLRPAWGRDTPHKYDAAVNDAYDNAGDILTFYHDVLGINSIDNAGHKLNVTIHYRNKYANAYWDDNLEEVFVGDGDGFVFGSYNELDILAHEVDHGHSWYYCNIEYSGQGAALLEHKSDVFAVTVEQWKQKQAASENSFWTIGAKTMIDWYDKEGNKVFYLPNGNAINEQGVVNPDLVDFAIRTFKNEKAYTNHPLLPGSAANDIQVKHMKDYAVLPNTKSSDFGGAHINCGILNHAYYLASTAIGGYAWENTFLIWREAFKRAPADCDFETFARLTIAVAKEWGANNTNNIKPEHVGMVEKAWEGVGVV